VNAAQQQAGAVVALAPAEDRVRSWSHIQVFSHAAMTASDAPAAVLFLDIADSSAMTSRLGDLEAGRLLRLLLDRLKGIVERHGGRAVKSDGDDLIVYFAPGENVAARALEATIGCMLAAQDNGLGLYAGLASGPVQVTEVLGRFDISGHTVITAARLHKLIEGLSGRIFVSAATVSALPAALAGGCKAFGSRVLKGLGEIEVFTYEWQDGNSTEFVNLSLKDLPLPELWLGIGGREARFSAHQSPVQVGRQPDRADSVVVEGTNVSGRHLDFIVDGQVWRVRDRSRCGTWLRVENGSVDVPLAGKSAVLLGAGALCLGRHFADDPTGEFTLAFRVEAPTR